MTVPLVINRDAIEYARRHGGWAFQELGFWERRRWRRILAQAIAEGWAFGRLRDEARAAFHLSPDRTIEIVQRESSRARSMGNLISARRNQTETFRLNKTWWAAEDSCAICKRNGEIGPLPLDALFPSGDLTPPAKGCEFCRCTLAYQPLTAERG